LLVSQHNSLRVLFDKIASAYFVWKIYQYFSIGNGQPREPALCHLYRHTFVPYQQPLNKPLQSRSGQGYSERSKVRVSLRLTEFEFVSDAASAPQGFAGCAWALPGATVTSAAGGGSRDPVFASSSASALSSAVCCDWLQHNTHCRMTNYELLRWLVETPSRDVDHYHMFNASRSHRVTL